MRGFRTGIARKSQFLDFAAELDRLDELALFERR